MLNRLLARLLVTLVVFAILLGAAVVLGFIK
jgi:hypothetical protein